MTNEQYRREVEAEQRREHERLHQKRQEIDRAMIALQELLRTELSRIDTLINEASCNDRDWDSAGIAACVIDYIEGQSAALWQMTQDTDYKRPKYLDPVRPELLPKIDTLKLLPDTTYRLRNGLPAFIDDTDLSRKNARHDGAILAVGWTYDIRASWSPDGTCLTHSHEYDIAEIYDEPC